MYITICIFVFSLSLILTFFAEKKLIPFLSKHAKQPIYEGGPSWHISKKGTPTMGGIGFIIGIVISLIAGILYLNTHGEYEYASSLILALYFSFANSLVGIFDDVTKLKRKENAGLTPKQKLFLQLIIAVVFILLRNIMLEDTTSIHFPFGSLDMGIVYYPFAIIMLLGVINCANLTDGIDGLAASVAFAIGSVLLIISVPQSPEASVLSSALVGGTLAFLIFNTHPAKIFMGDTGSLFLGALIASVGFTLGNPAILIPICAVYVFEGISVILQVVSFKLFGKRIFKMAPFHHHLERCGMEENRICIFAVIATFLCAFAALLIYKI